MKIGVPIEIKDGETRVAMTPSLCRRCVRLGATVLVQKGAGLRAGFLDAEYRKAGAKITNTAVRTWREADLVVKVKEPQPGEFKYFRSDLTLFTYLHLAACPDLAAALVKQRVLGIAYESVESYDRYLPLLKPMSHIAGRLSIQTGAYLLQTQNGGSGVLLGGVPGTMPGRVAIVGAGNSGAHACRMAMGMGARVVVLDLDARKLEMIDEEYRGGVVTLIANPGNIETAVRDCDLLIGAVLVPNAKAPTVVTTPMVKTMRPGSVIVDIAIDQGGCIATIAATSHREPTYLKHGVVHYAVPNMPALVGRTSTLALTQATEPYLVNLVSRGIPRALKENEGLAKGVNTQDGKVVNAQVAKALGYR
jgi:alanine dehydrogenase